MPMVAAAAVPKGSRAFGAKRRRKDGSKRNHNGIDLYAPLGDPVHAPVAGTIRLASKVWRERFSGYGRFVVLDFGDMELLVGHLEDVDVAEGDKVVKGQQIGTVGDTKFTKADKTARFDDAKPHVHVELLRGRYPVHPDTARLDPTALAFFQKKNRMVA